MVGGNYEIIASHDKISALVEPVGDSQCLTLNDCVSGLGWVEESAAYKT